MLRHGARWTGLWLLALAGLASLGHAETGPDGNEKEPVPDDAVVTMFPHSETARYWISGQDNIILQYHPSFPAHR